MDIDRRLSLLVAPLRLSSRIWQHKKIMIHPYVKHRPEARVPALHKAPRTYQRGYVAPLGKDHHHETKRGPKSLTSSSVATIETATSQSESML